MSRRHGRCWSSTRGPSRRRTRCSALLDCRPRAPHSRRRTCTRSCTRRSYRNGTAHRRVLHLARFEKWRRRCTCRRRTYHSGRIRSPQRNRHRTRSSTCTKKRRTRGCRHTSGGRPRTDRRRRTRGRSLGSRRTRLRKPSPTLGMRSLWRSCRRMRPDMPFRCRRRARAMREVPPRSSYRCRARRAHRRPGTGSGRSWSNRCRLRRNPMRNRRPPCTGRRGRRSRGPRRSRARPSRSFRR